MRSAIRIPLAAVTATTIALVLGMSQATAGGPTSVLIVNPTTAATGSLYTSDANYALLSDALEPREKSSSEDAPPGLMGGPGTSAINITWLVHDVSVWRVDRVHVGDEGGPWVQTTEVDMSQENELLESQESWHRPADPNRLLAVLDQLGVLGTDVGADTDAIAPLRSETGTGAGVSTGWWWLLPGLGAGVAIGVFGRWYVAALLARREPGPRHQLIDA